MKPEINEYNINGFCLLEKKFFDEKDIKRIEKIIDGFIINHNKNIEMDRIVMGGNTVAIKNFIDESTELKDYINKIFINEKLSNIIKNNIGENFKITDIVYRKSYPGDGGLDMHQDAEGENTVIINLSGSENSDGKTFFLKSSQKYKSIIDLIHRGSISVKLSKFLKFFFDFIDCSNGSILMFNNRVWHGRFSNQSRNISSSLLIGLYKEGSIIKYDAKKDNFQKIKSKLDYSYELDNRRNLGQIGNFNKVLNTYAITTNNLAKNDIVKKIKIKSLKTKFYIYLIKFIYFFKRN